MNSSLPRFWEHFKLPHESIEENVTDRSGSYQGLKEEALYTGREDYLRLFNHPLTAGTLVDLGCGAGEGCLLYGSLFPDRKAIGVEFEKARIEFGQRLRTQYKLDNVDLILADLMSDHIPVGDTYFLYFPTGPVLDRILHVLYHSPNKFRLIAIESHGDLIPRLNLENWLTFKAAVPLHATRHHPDAHLYEHNFQERDSSLLPFELSFKDRYLLIKENEELWIGNSRGLEWTCDDRFELLTPPRTIFWKNVQSISDGKDFSALQKLAIALRNEGELEFSTLNKKIIGTIRKIIIAPSFSLEFSTGEKVEWKQILKIKKGRKLCYVTS
ncbi:MAG: class I SAM-dependent methyltransferase [Bacteriovoracaceae bacterium]|nr:class I SAM-dependent methyltransferase [Bacteriovoracaceae bacterium]